MTITHDPDLDAREPADGDLETFHSLTPGDQVSLDELVGERVRVEAVGEESFLYEVDGRLWHYVKNQPNREENPYPVENLVLKERAET